MTFIEPFKWKFIEPNYLDAGYYQSGERKWGRPQVINRKQKRIKKKKKTEKRS